MRKKIYWPHIINRLLLAGIVVNPLIISLIAIHLTLIFNEPIWKALLIILLAAPLVAFLSFWEWSWYSTEGSGPVD